MVKWLWMLQPILLNSGVADKRNVNYTWTDDLATLQNVDALVILVASEWQTTPVWMQLWQHKLSWFRKQNKLYLYKTPLYWCNCIHRYNYISKKTNTLDYIVRRDCSSKADHIKSPSELLLQLTNQGICLIFSWRWGEFSLNLFETYQDV